MLFNLIIEHRVPPQVLSALAEIVTALASLNKTGVRIMNNLKKLDDTITALEAKSAETVQTLGALAQAVIDLKNSGDVQAGIDALAARAQTIVDNLGAAEDSADDQVPTAPTP
jgi:uncharacterized coiled-coil protein SlyX